MYICVFGSMRRLSCLNNLYDITLIVLPESMNAIIDLLLILAVMSMNRKIGRGVSLNRPPMCWYERRVLTPFVLREMMELVSCLFFFVGELVQALSGLDTRYASGIRWHPSVGRYDMECVVSLKIAVY